MAPQTVYLPNGQTITVSPVFAGFSFKANDLNIHQSIFPPGWTVILETSEEEEKEESESTSTAELHNQIYGFSRRTAGRYKRPTLSCDNLFISSISNPSSADFKPATSPTRQIAMMLWATLMWYFHQVWHFKSLASTPLNHKATDLSTLARTKSASHQRNQP